MEVNLEFLFSWPLFHSVSWETDEKFSFWLNTHTHTPLDKASPVEGWRIKRKGHILNTCQMTEHPTVYLPVLKYPLAILSPPSPLRRLLTTLSSCLTQPPLPIPTPSTSWTVLWILPLNSSCRSAGWFYPLQVLPLHAWRCQTYTTASHLQGPIPPWQRGCTSLSHHTVHIFLKFGCFWSFKKHSASFCQRPSSTFAAYKASVSHFIDRTNKLICSPNGNFIEGYIFPFTIWLIDKLLAVRLIVIFSSL